MYPQIFLKSEKTASVFRRHRWIFSGAIDKKPESLENGQIVEILDNTGKFLAVGHYFNSSISVRILSFENEKINKDFWVKKIHSAFNYRKTVLNLPNKDTNAFRLVFGESDGLPGLIIDIFNDLAVLQCHNIAIFNALDHILYALQSLPIKINFIFNKSENLIKNVSNSFLLGKCNNFKQITENGFHFVVDFLEGQKTGFFLDQKQNRQIVSQFSANKRILNLFSYSGSFSVYALAGGAKEVVNVDISHTAIASTEQNINLNFNNALQTNVVSDVFEFLSKEKSKFDMIIVDPPAFAKTNGKQDAAANNHRTCRIVSQLYQSPDHPIDIFHPETEYLKGFLLAFD